MKKGQLRVKIQNAKDRLTAAEQAMARVLEQIEPAALADKTVISAALRSAFNEVTVARRELLELEELLPPEV